MALKNYSASSLIGGGSGALDSIDGSALVHLDSALVFSETNFYIYMLDATLGGTENSPHAITPDTNAGNKRWVLVGSFGTEGLLTLSNTGLHLLDTGAAFDLIVKPGSSLTEDRTLTVITGDANRELTISGTCTLNDWFNQSVKSTATPTFSELVLTTDLAVAHGGTGASDAPTALVNLGLTAVSAELNVLDGITADVGELNILDGVTATASEINNACDLSVNSFFGAGRKVLFYEDTAPVGWSIEDTLDDKLVFVTKGSAAAGQTGGQAHSSGSWTISGLSSPSHAHTLNGHIHTTPSHQLSVAELPFHNHAIKGFAATYADMALSSNWSQQSRFSAGFDFNGGSIEYTQNSDLAGSNAAHSHGNTGGNSSNSSSVAATINQDASWRPAAYNCIICTKS